MSRLPIKMVNLVPNQSQTWHRIRKRLNLPLPQRRQVQVSQRRQVQANQQAHQQVSPH